MKLGLGLGFSANPNNFPYGLPRWGAALNGVLNGTRNATVCCVGDSLTANSAANGQNRSLSYPSKLAGYMTANGVAAKYSAVNGTNNKSTPANYTTYQPNVTFATPGDWTMNGTTYGGQCFQTLVLNSRYIVTFSETVDTIEIVLMPSAGNGGVGSIYIDGGGTAIGTINTNLTGAPPQRRTYTVAPGAHTVEIAMTSGTVLFVSQVWAYNSAVKNVLIHNGGQPSDTTLAMLSGVSTIRQLAPDLGIIMASTNDQTAGTTQASFESSLTSLVSVIQESGDALLVFPPSRNAGAEANFAQWYQNVDTAKNCQIIDVRSVFGTFAQAQAAGYMAPDNVHTTDLGLNVIAKLDYNRIRLPSFPVLT